MPATGRTRAFANAHGTLEAVVYPSCPPNLPTWDCVVDVYHLKLR